VNSRGQLAELERIYQRRLAAALLEQGVALADPSRCDVRRESCLRPRCGDRRELRIRRRREVGDGVSVGANCVLKCVTVGAGTRIELSVTWRTPTSAQTPHRAPTARIRPARARA